MPNPLPSCPHMHTHPALGLALPIGARPPSFTLSLSRLCQEAAELHPSPDHSYRSSVAISDRVPDRGSPGRYKAITAFGQIVGPDGLRPHPMSSRSKRSLERTPTIPDEAAVAMRNEMASTTVSPQDIKSGSLLESLATSHCCAARQLLPKHRAISPDGPMRWGSMVCGCESLDLMWKAVEQAQRSSLPTRSLPTYKLVFGHATTEPMYQWSKDFVNKFDDSVCIFKKFPEKPKTGSPQSSSSTGSPQMSGRHVFGECWTHGQKCTVPPCEWLHVGWKVNGGKSSVQAAINTLTTYLDCCSSVVVIIFESADLVENTQAASSKMELVDAHLGGRGFEPTKFLMGYDRFGIPQDLRKLVAVYVKSGPIVPAIDFESRSITDMLNTLQKLVAIGSRAPPPARSLFLFDSDELVELALRRDLQRGEPTSVSKDWVGVHQQAYQALGIRWGSLAASPSLLSSPWWPTLSPQQKDALLLYTHAHKGKGDLIIDLDSNPQHPRTSHVNGDECDIVPALVLKAKFWIHSGRGGRPVVPAEKLLLLGFPVGAFEKKLTVTDQTLLEAIALSMPSVPLLLPVVMATCAAVSWKACSSPCAAEVPTASEVEDALLVLKSLKTSPS